MKLIDVLVKMANGEEVKPFTLGGGDIVYSIEEHSKDLFGITGETGEYLVDDDGDPVHWCIYKEWLNEEVEFIDDKKDKKRKKKEENEDAELIEAINKLVDLLKE